MELCWVEAIARVIDPACFNGKVPPEGRQPCSTGEGWCTSNESITSVPSDATYMKHMVCSCCERLHSCFFKHVCAVGGCLLCFLFASACVTITSLCNGAHTCYRGALLPTDAVVRGTETNRKNSRNARSSTTIHSQRSQIYRRTPKSLHVVSCSSCDY